MSSAIGENWNDVRQEIFTPEEIMAGDLRVALIVEMIKARKKQGLSQRKLGELTGVSQPVIARMEKGETIPQIDTLLKLLFPLGKTLSITTLKAN